MIYLIRHGETEANIKHIYCGSTDIPLSSTGIEKLQARRDEEVMYRIRKSAEQFVTSGMIRTDQTLKLLFGDVDYKVEPRFREIDFGIFEMRSYYELKDTPEYQQWLAGDNEANVCPGGESGQQMEMRVMEAFKELQAFLMDSADKNVVVVTHGGVIAAIMSNLFPGDGKNRFEWQPAPGHGYAICENGYYEVI